MMRHTRISSHSASVQSKGRWVAVSIIRKLVPATLKQHLELFVARVARDGLQKARYTPWEGRMGRTAYAFDEGSFAVERKGEALPVPPPELRMWYATESDERFLEDGLAAATSIRAILAEHGVTFGADSVCADWGCASGRVLRHFAREAEVGEFWGLDQDEKYIMWDKANLSPPFKFLTSTDYPHLPFEDNTFSFFYGISVFTHIENYPDLWLMEIRRVLRRGGYALFTAHAENTAAFFQETGKPNWIPEDIDLVEMGKHDAFVISHGEWYDKHVFYNTAFLRKEWGQYFEVVDFKPLAIDGFHNAVLLRKP